MKYFTLLQLNQSISKHLRQIEQEFWIVAEIASIQQRKHFYLELVQKEEEEIVAKSRAMIWANRLPYLRLQLGSDLDNLLKNGVKVLMRVSISYHEVHGLMLIISELDSSYTLGELASQRAKTIQQLEEKGLLELQKKLNLTLVPQKIAVISSENAAGWNDFWHHLVHNPYQFRFDIQLFSAQVQGEKALEELLSQFQEISQQPHLFDVVVLIRGGGSTLDLEVFNQYALAKTISCFPIPVLSGVGHQKDVNVCDLVAFKAFKTPTAVADFLIEKALEFYSSILEKYDTILKSIQNIIQEEKYHLERNQIMIQKFVENYLQSEKQKLLLLPLMLKKQLQYYISLEKNKLEHIKTQITANDPQKILEKGYSIVLKNGKPITSKNQVNEGDIIENILKDGKVKSRIEKV
ncbi:MAG: exodeoxyribonuclease VII large subunit [Flammeovirgaceae bacterium]